MVVVNLEEWVMEMAVQSGGHSSMSVDDDVDIDVSLSLYDRVIA